MTEIIKVKLENYSTLKIDADKGVCWELRDHFSFLVEGHQFMPAFRNKMWDGVIRIFNLQKQELPAGLYLLLKKFCDDRQYVIEIVESEYGDPTETNNIDVNEIMTFIESLNITSKDEKITVRDYQFNSICETLKNKRLTIISPTGSGKSLVIYILIRYLIEKIDNKILLIVPTTSLVEQMYTDFEDYSKYDDSWNVKEECHRIYAGKEKVNVYEKIYISTWQSVYKLPKNWFRQFDVVFGDEVHGFKAASLTSIMNKSINASWRIGTTGTLDGSQVHELVLQGQFGKIYKAVTTKKLQEREDLASLNINMLELVYPEEICKNFGKQSYQLEIDFIIGYEARNKFIRNLALNLQGNTLILFQYVEKHGKILHSMISDKVEENRKVFFVAGEVQTEDREAIRAIIETQSDSITTASMGVFSTGVNIKNLHNIIFASPTKSQIRVLQSIGRGLRMSDNREPTRLYDLNDNLSWKTRVNYTMKHAEHRRKIYKKEGFNMKHNKVILS